jgi:aspartate/methionine/tyrosine aminotransferase
MTKRRRVARNVSVIALSAIMEMAMRSAKVPGAASLAWGLPSFKTPEHIRRAVKLRLDEDPDVGKYALPDGLPELREAVARDFLAVTGIAADPDGRVLITAGNMEGLNSLFHVLIDPGDEVIVTDPGFVSHFHQIRLCGGRSVSWRLDEARGWSLDLEVFPRLITARTKAVLLVSPSNPTGKMFSEDELRRVGEIARAHNLLILLDDPYRHFIYENRNRYFNLASVAELAEHVVYLFSFSKCHAMSGWRAGYMILPEQLKPEVLKVHDATMICAPRISQIAAVAALNGASEHLLEFERILARRRDLICERLNRMPHVFSYVRPDGAYYVFARIEVPHTSSFDFASKLLEEARVAVTPGGAFGSSGEHHVRMAFCVDEDTINLAFDRIDARFGA